MEEGDRKGGMKSTIFYYHYHHYYYFFIIYYYYFLKMKVECEINKKFPILPQRQRVVSLDEHATLLFTLLEFFDFKQTFRRCQLHFYENSLDLKRKRQMFNS